VILALLGPCVGLQRWGPFGGGLRSNQCLAGCLDRAPVDLMAAGHDAETMDWSRWWLVRQGFTSRSLTGLPPRCRGVGLCGQ